MTRALVTPEVLRWARESASILEDEAGAKIGVSGDRIREWEGGAAQPTVKQARHLARVYEQPFAAFFLPTPPALFRPRVTDFRRLPRSADPQFHASLVLDIRSAHERRDLALELLKELEEAPSPFMLEAALGESAEEVGQRIRSFLGIDIQVQAGWTSTSRALSDWRARIDRAGALVFQTSRVPVSEMRGYSLAHYPLPVIVLNRKDSAAGRLFTLLHELVHLMLHVSGVCDPHQAGRDGAHELERYCNHVAAATIVPMVELLAQPSVKNTPGPVWEDAVLWRLAASFRVSREVILRRLLSAGKTTQAFYEFKRKQIVEGYKAKPGRKGFIDPVTNTLSRSGKRFLTTVVEAYNAELITSTDAADLTGLRSKHLEKLMSVLST